MRATASVVLAAVLGVLVVVASALTIPAAGGVAVAFLAAVVGAEVLAAARDDDLSDPVDAEPFRISTPVHLAAMVVAGPWVAALAGVVAVLASRLTAPLPWRDLLTREVTFAVAGLAGGYAYVLAGSETGTVVLPDDVLGVCVVVAAYAAVRTIVHGLAAGLGLFPPDVRTLAGEGAIALVLALAADSDAWLLLAAVPTMLLLEHAHHRLGVMRGEVAVALETFANIVDDRDPSTHRHSVRVAGYVEELAQALGLPPLEVARLRWAGRLHDLGKVAVDAAVLRKRGLLSPSEWAAVRRSPRLSARLLQRFRFAARQAQAVEYHHERLDGSGYYGVEGDAIPLASHFLILADSFDAMTTDRPFRPAMRRDAALTEIERNTGSQFHPTLARAFVAVQNGQPVSDVLAPEELRAIRDASTDSRPPSVGSLGSRIFAPAPVGVIGTLTALVALSAGMLEVAALGAAAALLGAGSAALHELRARRLSAALARALADDWAEPERVFEGVVDGLTRGGAWWVGLVAWNADGLGGSLVRSHGGESPDEAALISWLVRHGDSKEGVFSAGIFDLGSPVAHLAVPLRRETAELAGFLVIASPRLPAAHVVQSLRANLHALGLALSPRPLYGDGLKQT
ncbi:MAG TPA: HD domain-containing phosphohydrolase [Gaiellaceae bacterium]|nr:HD domain-containing phosphohydrolase [Gaiellaceae bacterium]